MSRLRPRSELCTILARAGWALIICSACHEKSIMAIFGGDLEADRKNGRPEKELKRVHEQVKNGAEVIVKDRNRPVARLLRHSAAELDAEEAALVAEGLMRVPAKEKSNDFLKLLSPRVSSGEYSSSDSS